MSQTMKYKGYEGAVLFSAEDRLLHGKLLHIRDTVIYGGEDIPTLETNFRGAVDEYLAFCEADGREPDKPSAGGIDVHVPADLTSKATQYASKHNTSVDNVVHQAISEYIAHAG